MGYLASGFPSTPINVNPGNDSLISGKAKSTGQDPDGDGIPNSWETAHGLDPGKADGNSHTLDPSYTNLEVYLNDPSLLKGVPEGDLVPGAKECG